MRIYVTSNPGAKIDKVEKMGLRHYKVSVKAYAVEGRANKAIISLLAEYFKTKKSLVFLVSGHIAKQKVFEVLR